MREMGMGTSWAFPALASVKTIRREEQEILFCVVPLIST